MRPGPRPIPPELQAARGNPGRRPLAKRDVKPQAGASCPAWLSTEGKREWSRLHPELMRLGLVTTIDRASLAAYCEAWSDFVWSVKEVKDGSRVTIAGNGTAVQHPAVVIKKQAMEKIRQFAAEFGFSPSARARIDLVGSDEGEGDHDRFFGPRAAPPPGGKAKATKRQRGKRSA